MAKDNKSAGAAPTQGEQKTPEQIIAPSTAQLSGVAPTHEVQETSEQIIARLTQQLSATTDERDAFKEVAVKSTEKLEKLEKVQMEKTIEISGKTCKIALGKGQVKLGKSGLSQKFQFIKNEDGTLAEGHLYPTEEQWEEILERNDDLGVLEVL